jgi:hypothetical protein
MPLPRQRWKAEKMLLHLIDCHAESIGGIPSAEAQRLCTGLGLTVQTYSAARKSLGIKPTRDYIGVGGEWYLPPGCIRLRPSWAPTPTPSYHPDCEYCVPPIDLEPEPDSSETEAIEATGAAALLKAYRARLIK